MYSQAGSGRGSPSCVVRIRVRKPALVPLLLLRPSEGTEWEGKGKAVTFQNGVRAVALGSLWRTKHII